MQPAQQHGRRLPDFSWSIVLFKRRVLVSACFAVTTRQIHSFLASGVMSSHAASAFGAPWSAVLRSDGIL
jgi:hypothetical protein